jgi:hypothetical protein
MPYPLPLTRTEAYLAYKAGVIQQSDLKPSLAIPRNGIDAWLAYWTGLAEDYPKREDGTPHILQEEEAYIAYLCGVLDEYPEKCLRRVGAYLRYLISARWGRPDHPLNREELYLSLIKTQFIPSGDPSSDIVIDGTAKAAFVDVKMYGDTFQQTYTGKNLCGGTLAQIKNSNTGGTWNGNSYTQAGITWTVYENADGTIDRIEASGQATANGKTFYIESFNRQQFEEQLGSEETYTLSGCPQGGNSGYYVRVASIPWKAMLTDRGSAATGKLIPSDNYNSVFIILCVDTGAGQVNNLVFRPQLELGSTATSYEPFVGGQPSPSPEYPQPIQTVTGRQVVKVEGKNLWGGFANDFSRTSNGVEFVNKADGTITANGTSTGTALSLLSSDAISQNRLITLSAGDYIISGATDIVRLEVINTSGGVVADTSGSISGAKAFSISEPTQVAIRAKMANTYVADNVTIKPMLELGSTATAYEPYSSNDYEINLGKNLFDKTKMESGWLGTNGTITASNTIYHSDYMPVSPDNSYAYSGTTNSVDYAASACWYNDKKEYISGFRFGASGTVVAPATARYVRFSVRNGAGGNYDAETFQFEAGSTATTYAPYFEPIELCKIGTYQDYIWKDGEDWKVHKATTTETLNGSEDWGQDSSGGYQRFNIIRQNAVAPSGRTARGLSSHFTSDTNNGIGIFFLASTASGATRRFYFYPESNITTVEGFESWLNSNNTTLLYPLATPTDTVITDQNLIDQLNALKQGGAEEGTTYIKVSATDPNLPAKLYVEAPKYD